jgi:hypothetical protein
MTEGGAQEFMDLAEVREFLRRLGPQATKKLLQEATGVPVRMSQGIITAIDYDARQCTFKEFGDPGEKTNVAWQSYGVVPKISEPVWLLKWGNDGMIVGVSSGVMFSTPSHGRLPSAQIERTTDLSISNGALTSVAMQAKPWDTDAMVDPGFPGTNPTRLVPVRRGLYEVEAGMTWANNVTGRRIMEIKWVGAGSIARSSFGPQSTTGDAGHYCARQVWIDAATTPGATRGGAKGGIGNGFEMVVFQSSGGTLAIDASGVCCYLSCRYVGPEP